MKKHKFMLALNYREGNEGINENHKKNTLGSTQKAQRKEEDLQEFLNQVFDDFWFLIHKYPFKKLMDELERTFLICVLTKFEGNQRKTAEFLGLKPTTLNEKIKKHNILFRKIPYED